MIGIMGYLRKLKGRSLEINNIKSRAFALIAYGIVFFTNILYMLFNWENILNSDASSELLLAEQLNHEGTFISKNWFYSTELRVLNTQFVHKLSLFFFHDNWKYARCFSIAIFMLLILCVTVYIGNQLSSIEFGLWAAVLMIAPVGKWYANNIIYFSYYVPHIVITLVSIALVLHISKSEANKKIALSFILGILALVAGMGGIRQIMICYLPLIIATVIDIIFKAIKNNTINKNQLFCQNGYIISGIIALLASGIGYIINHKLQYVYRFRSYEVMNWNRFDLSNMIKVFGDYLSLLGWNDETAVMGIGGLGNAAALLLMSLLIISVIIYVRNYDKYQQHEKIFGLFFLSAFIVMLICYSGISTYNESYWVPLIPITYLFVMLVIKKALLESELIVDIKRCVIAVISAATVMCSISTMYYPYVSSVVQYGKDRMAMLQWVIDNDYNQVIAPFWDSNILTELTNGKIETWTVFKDLEIDRWLQVTAHDGTWPEGRVAVILEKAELTDLYDEAEMANYLVYEDDDFLVYDFDDVSLYQKILED